MTPQNTPNQAPDQQNQNNNTPSEPPQSIFGNADAQQSSVNTPIQPSKGKSKLLPYLLLLAVVLGGALAYTMLVNKPKKAAPAVSPTPTVTTQQPQKQPHLVFVSSADKSIIVTDKNAKKIYATNYTKEPYATFIAASPEGDLLFFLSNSGSGTNQQYLMVDRAGSQKTLSQQVQKVLLSANGNRGGSTISLKSGTQAVLTACTYQSATKDNSCNLLALNLNNGSTQNILSVTTPVASDTGDAFFALQGLSSNQQTAYLEVAGPTTLGKEADAIYAVNLTSKKATVLVSVPSGGQNASVSPDGKNVIYTAEASSSTALVIHVVNTATSKDTPVTWINDSVTSGSSLWQWSPDGTRVLFSGFQELPAKPGQLSNIGPTTYAFLDIAKGAITSLQTIQDAAHNNISYQSWLDNQTVVYEYDTTTDPNNFTNATTQLFTQDITSKQSTKLNGPSGNFEQVVSY